MKNGCGITRCHPCPALAVHLAHRVWSAQPPTVPDDDPGHGLVMKRCSSELAAGCNLKADSIKRRWSICIFYRPSRRPEATNWKGKGKGKPASRSTPAIRCASSKQ